MKLKPVSLSFTIFTCISVAVCQSIGDVCVDGNGNEGVCKLLPQCPSAMEKLKERVRPTICSFSGVNTVVCCPKVIAPNKSYDKIGEQKCKIYSDCNYLNANTTRVKREHSTLPTQFPHMVAIGWDFVNGGYAFLCEGSLVSENFVITAAHCSSVNDKIYKSSSPSIVRVGEINLKDPVGNHVQDIRVKNIFVHPKYNPPKRYDSLALIELEKLIVRSYFVNPICLWRSRNFANNEPVATGWGELDFLEGSSSTLRKVSIEVIDGGDCTKRYTYPTNLFPDNINSEQFCGTNSNLTTFKCQGDTGGPLQIIYPNSDCAHHLIGVTALGAGCGGTNLPAVYTRISSYIHWIENIVWAD